MISEERLNFIRQKVSGGSAVATTQLAEELRVSSETIRRDLKVLESLGEVRRVRGGAVARTKLVSREAPVAERASSNSLGKQRIGAVAASLCGDGKTVFVDIGTTAREVAFHLAQSFSGEVVTNSLLVARELVTSATIDVLVLPGHIRQGDLAVTGASTVEYMRGIHVDAAFISCGGIDASTGVTDYYHDETFVKQAVIENADQAYVIADALKINTVAKYRVCSFDQVTGLITDQPLPASMTVSMKQQEVRVFLP